MKNRFAKFALLISLALAVFAGGAAAQTSCRLQAKSAPLLLNLQIGMSPEQARAIFGKDLKIKIKKNGERTFFQNFIKQPAPLSLRGVRALYLRFFDRRLYQIEIFYEPRNDLKNPAELTTALASQFDLPASDWQTENNRSEIKCGETSLVADYVLNPRVELTDEIVRAKIETLRAAEGK